MSVNNLLSNLVLLTGPSQIRENQERHPLDEEVIGLNQSPLMAKCVAGGELDAWTDMAASIIENVTKKTEMPVYLIPHVTNPGLNDHEFMQRALSEVILNL